MMDVAVDSQLYKKTLGCLVGGLIGDAIGTPTENMAYGDIEAKFGWVDDFEADGTDDTVMKNILAEALVQTGGYARFGGRRGGSGDRAVERGRDEGVGRRLYGGGEKDRGF